MFRVLRPALTIIVSIACLNLAHAAGGVYVDSVKITNGKNVVLSEEFNKGNLEKWTNVRDAWTVCDEAGKLCSLCLNVSSSKYMAAATRLLHIETAGAIDHQAAFNIAPLEEQAPDLLKSGCEFTLSLYTKDATYQIDAEIQLSSTGYCTLALRDYRRRGGTFDAKRDITRVRLRNAPLMKWATLALHLDPDTSTATAVLDGVPLVTRDYNPEHYRTIEMVGVTSTFGDAVAHPEAVFMPPAKPVSQTK